MNAFLWLPVAAVAIVALFNGARALSDWLARRQRLPAPDKSAHRGAYDRPHLVSVEAAKARNWGRE